MGQKFAQYDAQGVITGFYDSVESPIPEGIVDVIEITDEEWQTCASSQGWTVANGALVAPVQLTASQIAAQQAALAWATYQANAKASLDASDITILRCYEKAVATPAAWSTYRDALRVIVSATSGDPTQPLPTKPAYPTGT